MTAEVDPPEGPHFVFWSTRISEPELHRHDATADNTRPLDPLEQHDDTEAWRYVVTSLAAMLVGFLLGLTGLGGVAFPPVAALCLPNMKPAFIISTFWISMWLSAVAGALQVHPHVPRAVKGGYGEGFDAWSEFPACFRERKRGLAEVPGRLLVAVRRLLVNFACHVTNFRAWCPPIIFVGMLLAVGQQFVLSVLPGPVVNLVVAVMCCVGGTSALRDSFKNKGSKSKAKARKKSKAVKYKAGESSPGGASQKSENVSPKSGRSVATSQQSLASSVKAELRMERDLFPRPTAQETNVMFALGTLVGITGGVPLLLTPTMFFLLPRLAAKRGLRAVKKMHDGEGGGGTPSDGANSNSNVAPPPGV